MDRFTRWLIAFGAFAATGLATVGSAAAAAQYSISPVTTQVGSEISGNLLTILIVVGSLLGLGIIIKMVRKFGKPG